jgi:DNA-binding CsgD family transcriptional regulator
LFDCTETVRNHVKSVLRRLNARSRVEAVAKARRLGVI